MHSPNFGRLHRCICQHKSDAIALQETFGSPIEKIGIAELFDETKGQRQMIFFSKSIIAGELTFLTFFGPNGTGKTTALMAIVTELLESGKGAIYVTAPDLMEYIKDGIGKVNGPDDRVSKMASVPVLCIDELAQLKMTDYVNEKLETILDRRYRHNKPTCFALDKDPVEVLSERFVSRLRSGAYVRIDGDDLRPLIGAKQTELFKKDAFERGE